jgi:NAD(P)-dependent dehydrogenase (short-subunit alcohol dehydrogenase family)
LREIGIEGIIEGCYAQSARTELVMKATNMTFRGKIIIITGASRGIGQALAIALAHQGANLVLAARNLAALEAVTNQIERVGIDEPQTKLGKAIAVPTDVTQPQDCQRLVETAIQTFGQIDILVNNAGLSMVTDFEAITDLSIFAQTMQVNYFGAVYCTHAALPHLKASRGLLVAISSLCGKTGVPMRSGYVASKHALQGFFDTLRIELRGTGVDVTVVSPGFVTTDIRLRALGGDGQPLGNSPRDENHGNMSVDACVDQIMIAIAQRQRDRVMTLKGHVLPWVKLIAPGFVDRIAAITAKTSQS